MSQRSWKLVSRNFTESGVQENLLKIFVCLHVCLNDEMTGAEGGRGEEEADIFHLLVHFRMATNAGLG